MNAYRKALLRCTIAVVLILAACEAPRQLVVKREPVEPGMGPLDPASSFLNLERERLRSVWPQNLGQIAEERVLRDVYLTGGLIVVEMGDGSLFHFDADDGKLEATTSLKSALTQPPVMIGERLYAVTGRGLLVIDSETGLTQDRFPLKIAPTALPVVFGASLIIGTGNGDVVRVGAQTGTRIWRFNVDGPVLDAPVYDPRNVYASGYKGKVACAAGREGTVLWQWEPKPPSKTLSGLLLADDNIYVGDNRGFIYCLTAREGAPLWKIPVGGPIAKAPIYSDGKILIFTTTGDLLCLRAGTEPTVLWRHGGIERLVATGAKDLYFLTTDQSILAVSKDSGEEQWRRPLVDDCEIVSDPSKSIFYMFRPNGAIMAIDELR
jgi:outer membrane protein assembly factor BamB